MSEQRPVAIVTGAASNIGLACARRFAATHTVIMADIVEAAQQAADLPRAVAVRVNVGDFDSCLHLAAEARKHGPVAAVVHSAGITRPACSILDMSVAEWEDVIRINLTGAFLLAKACIPVMLETGGGAMTLFSSRAAKTGSPRWTHPGSAAEECGHFAYLGMSWTGTAETPPLPPAGQSGQTALWWRS